MIRLLAVAAAVLPFGLAFGQSVPKILIVQTRAIVENGNDLNVNMRLYFAQEFDEDGRLEPVSWTSTDPAFRQAVEAKLLVDPPESPTTEQAQSAAEKLGCEYTFILSALRHGPNVVSNAYMYKGKREVWKSSNISQTTVQDVLQLESTARTLARTWIFQMGEGPLKGLKPRPRVRTPDPDPGSRPPPPPPDDPVDKADDPAIRTEYERLIRLGEVRAAIQLLRDAVDSEPLKLSRRKLLIQALMDRGQVQEAAREARRSAGLFPEEVELWRLCARTAISAGDSTQAIRDLNEAVAREPENADTRLLLGIAQLMAGRTEFALEHLDASIKLAPTADSRLFRAFAYLLHGKAGAAQEDLKHVVPAGATHYSGTDSNKALALRLALGAIDRGAQSMRDRIQLVRLRPEDRAHATSLKAMAEQMDGIQGLLSIVGPLPATPKAAEASDLALNLLLQCIHEASGYLTTRSPDALADATLTLGEVFRSLDRAKSELNAAD